MKKEVKKCYVAPTVESLELAVEQGFAGSNGWNPNPGDAGWGGDGTGNDNIIDQW